MSVGNPLDKYDYNQRSIDWWSFVEDVIDKKCIKSADYLLFVLQNRKGGLSNAISRYKKILDSKATPGITTMAMCNMFGVDYMDMMRDRLSGCERLLKESDEQIQLVKEWYGY